MKSKTYWTKNLRGYLKQNAWYPAVLLLTFLIVFPIMGILRLDENIASADMTKALLQLTFARTISFDASLLILAGVMGIVGAISGFRYLHVASQVDFYHAIPIKRKQLFDFRLRFYVFSFGITYLVSLILAFGVGVARGVMSVMALKYSLYAFVISMLWYLVSYLLTALVMMVTGNALMMGLGIVTGFGYGYLVSTILSGFAGTFFKSFPSGGAGMQARIAHALSPLSFTRSKLNAILGSINDGNGVARDAAIAALIYLVVAALVLYVVNQFTYQRRPSEAAGRALAFPWLGVVLKILVGTFGVLLVAILTYSLGFQYKIFWLYLSLIVSAFLIAGVMEAMFQSDFRKFFSKLPQTAIMGALAVVVVLIFQLDVFHYDTYLPDREDVKRTSIVMNDYSINIYDENSNSLDAASYALEHMDLGNNAKAYNFVEELTQCQIAPDTAREEALISFNTQMELDNGKTISRTYTVPVEKISDDFANVYEQMAYKKGVYPILLVTENHVSGISMELDGTQYYTAENAAEQEKFLNAYKQDIQELTAEEAFKEATVGSITFTVDQSQVQTYPIYAGCGRTLGLLDQQGLVTVSSQDPEQIVSILVEALDDQGEVKKSKEFTHTADIAQILPNVCPQVYDSSMDVYKNGDYQVTVKGKDFQGIICNFVNGKIPSLVSGM